MLQVLKTNYYAGIGSRETPPHIMRTMTQIAQAFSKKSWILRSGGADGADTAFETGCDENKEIWLPWKNFNENISKFYLPENLNTNAVLELGKVARKFHPRWSNLKMGAKRMMVRNVCQVLGYDLNNPVEFVVCWTKDGKDSGGTGQAIRIAEDREIPVFNLFRKEDLEHLRNIYKNYQYDEPKYIKGETYVGSS